MEAKARRAPVSKCIRNVSLTRHESIDEQSGGAAELRGLRSRANAWGPLLRRLRSPSGSLTDRP